MYCASASPDILNAYLTLLRSARPLRGTLVKSESFELKDNQWRAKSSNLVTSMKCETSELKNYPMKSVFFKLSNFNEVRNFRIEELSNEERSLRIEKLFNEERNLQIEKLFDEERILWIENSFRTTKLIGSHALWFAPRTDTICKRPTWFVFDCNNRSFSIPIRKNFRCFQIVLKSHPEKIPIGNQDVKGKPKGKWKNKIAPRHCPKIWHIRVFTSKKNRPLNVENPPIDVSKFTLKSVSEYWQIRWLHFQHWAGDLVNKKLRASSPLQNRMCHSFGQGR